MVWVAVAFAVVAVAAVVAWLVTRRDLDRQRSLTATAERRITEHTAEIAGLAGQLDEERDARAVAEDQVKATKAEVTALAQERDRARGEAETSTAEHHAALERATNAQALAAEERRRAADAERRAADAERRGKAAQEQVTTAADRAASAEQRLADAERQLAALSTATTDTSDGEEPSGDSDVEDSTPAPGGGDETGEILWALELSRSERTWRNSVAVSTDGPSVLDGASDVLLEALNIEVDAAREEVGAIVELDADIPGAVNTHGSLVALRATQELLDAMMRRSEVTTVHVYGDGTDLIVTIDGVDEHDQPVAPPALALPPSTRIEAIDGGVRIRDAVS